MLLDCASSCKFFIYWFIFTDSLQNIHSCIFATTIVYFYTCTLYASKDTDVPTYLYSKKMTKYISMYFCTMATRIKQVNATCSTCWLYIHTINAISWCRLYPYMGSMVPAGTYIPKRKRTRPSLYSHRTYIGVPSRVHGPSFPWDPHCAVHGPGTRQNTKKIIEKNCYL